MDDDSTRRPWLFQSSFWRDVTSQVIAGLVVAAAVAAAAAGAGVIDWVTVARVIIAIGFALVSIGGGVTLSLLYAQKFDPFASKITSVRDVLVRIGFFIPLLAGLLLVAVFSILQGSS